MSAQTFYVKSLERSPTDRPTDRLEFEPGVNLLVGEADAGKTRWLSMLDYLLGDFATPLDALGKTISEKYDSIKAVLVFSDGEEVVLERHWKQAKGIHKILINGEPTASDNFDGFIFSKLGIPLVKYPKGNPFADKAGWVTLGWRSLFRSIYRQERFWSAFVEKQPEFETAACLLQFLGVADKQFPESHEQLAIEVRKLQRLEGQRDAYEAVLHTVTLDLLKQKELTVAVTTDSIAASKTRIDRELSRLREEREHFIREVIESETSAYDQRFQALRSKREALDERRNDLVRGAQGRERRLLEIRGQIEGVEAEMTRLKRVRKADSVLSGIKVSHCPVCEQPATEDDADPNLCYLCGKVHAESNVSPEGRLDFELDQLQEELNELAELYKTTEESIGASQFEIEQIVGEIAKMDADLRPAVRLATTNMPPDLAVIDLQIGRLNEQMSQLARVSQTLDEQTELSKQITKLEGEIEKLRDRLKAAHAEVDFNFLSRVLEDGMNTYLNVLNKNRPGFWAKGQLEVELRARSFDVMIREASVTAELGAASNAVALFAFHYALLLLSVQPARHYPGIVILDFPLTLATGSDLKGAENYLIEPFVELLKEPAFENCQLIAAGRSFHGLTGARQIEIKDAYDAPTPPL